MVQMLRGENAEVLEGLQRELFPEVRAVLPSGVAIEPIYDRSDLVNATLRTVGKNLLEGGLLVAVILSSCWAACEPPWWWPSPSRWPGVGAVVGMVALEVPGNLMSLAPSTSVCSWTARWCWWRPSSTAGPSTWRRTWPLKAAPSAGGGLARANCTSS